MAREYSGLSHPTGASDRQSTRSQAGSIEVQIIFGETDLRVRIRDDGRGIDDATLATGAPGRWGLKGMQERAHRIGARLDIWSRPGAGTEIERSPGGVEARSHGEGV